ncbi:type II toxin-antitoxin system ParD family antitoxin [Thalassobaculum litoreum]|uniref:Antitoxin ParD1/3/4 n=1 Tax=Thalassobaculum litoreum DSM 18839 TaxID=1123362 RepID=A0A8G2EW61_9PROT|nr:type II toxin-antitoxin system ParD family antitoxin [Thalassobaculum litoreum]SDG14273.1 antitoxin ParD1/3/4 [Thalassobaculum litoreum DSM 18839]
MPTRNINLTEYYDNYLAEVLASGRYKNASEAVRAGLRLLEFQEREEQAKLEALRSAFQEGKDAFERGDYATLHGDADIDRYFDEVAQEADQPA